MLSKKCSHRSILKALVSESKGARTMAQWPRGMTLVMPDDDLGSFVLVVSQWTGNGLLWCNEEE